MTHMLIIFVACGNNLDGSRYSGADLLPAGMELEPDAAAAGFRGGGGDALTLKNAHLQDALIGSASPDSPPPKDEPADAGGSGVTGRSWFPEAFLWRPLVETGDDGEAHVEVRVPDQLSTFRVLALAHDRRGQQAGTTHELQTRLPVYVEPVVPQWLYAGDRFELPVRLVNGSDLTIRGALSVKASGALQGLGSSSMTLSPGSSDVRRIDLVARGSGPATVRAEVQADPYRDAAERTIEVLPTGRPVLTTESRRLSADPFVLEAPRGADRDTEQIEVVVFGGPWSVFQAEVERIAAGVRPVDPAYGFALSAHVGALAQASEVAIDPDRHKLLRAHAWQRIAKRAQSPSPAQAVDLLSSLRSVEGDELVDALLPQLVRRVVDGQRADGTWSRTGRSTLQQVLVQTAVAARALPSSERGPQLRATGAVERSLTSIDDAYTASVVLAADLVPSDDRARLQAMVRDAVEERSVVVPETVRNANGARPTPAERLAWAIIALDPDDEVGGSLVSELMGLWRADRGFGAGPADAVALDAIARALPPRSELVTLSLHHGDQIVGSATLDPTQPRVPARFTLRPTSSRTTLSVTSGSVAPGLVMVATRRSWVDWLPSDRVPGVDVDVRVDGLEVGRSGIVRLAIAAPSDSTVEVRQGLPAGVSALEAEPTSRATVRQFPDEIVVTTAPFRPDEAIEVVVPVVPAFAGRFSTASMRISVDGGPPVELPPVSWNVRP